MKEKQRGIIPFKVGDRIAITSLLSLEEDKIQTIKGIVIDISKNNRIDGTFTILNSVSGVGFTMKIPIWSPFIRHITMVEEAPKKSHRKRLKYYSELSLEDVRVKPF